MNDSFRLIQMERRARLRKIMATMDDEDERKAALPGKPLQLLALSCFVHTCTACFVGFTWLHCI